MADGAGRARQGWKRRRDLRPALHAGVHRERQVQRRNLAELRANRLAGVQQFRARRLGDVNHVTGASGRLDQRLVRLLARPLGVADHELRPVGLGEQHVVDDGFGAARREVVEERGMHQPRPRPAPDQRLHAFDAVVVDGDEDDPGTGGCLARGGGGADAPVVQLHLRRADEAAEPNQQREKGRGGAEPDTAQQSCQAEHQRGPTSLNFCARYPVGTISPVRGSFTSGPCASPTKMLPGGVHGQVVWPSQLARAAAHTPELAHHFEIARGEAP